MFFITNVWAAAEGAAAVSTEASCTEAIADNKDVARGLAEEESRKSKANAKANKRARACAARTHTCARALAYQVLAAKEANHLLEASKAASAGNKEKQVIPFLSSQKSSSNAVPSTKPKLVCTPRHNSM